MGEPDAPSGGDGASGRAIPERRHRLGPVLALLVLAGLPFVCTGRILSDELGGPPPLGAQPGGRVAGRTIDTAGVALPGRRGRAVVDRPARAPRALRVLESGARGEFSFDAPALEGCYALRAGGGTHRRVERYVSLVGGEESPELELELAPGAR